jgi:hypothetical protein
VHPKTRNDYHALVCVGLSNVVRDFVFWYRWAVETDLVIDGMLDKGVDAHVFELMVPVVGVENLTFPRRYKQAA